MADSSLGFTVRDALFRPLRQEELAGGSMEVLVFGRGFEDRAIPLAARLGKQQLAGIIVNPAGDGFSGAVERMPRAGDRLHVGYADGELEATEVVFRGMEPLPMV